MTDAGSLVMSTGEVGVLLGRRRSSWCSGGLGLLFARKAVYAALSMALVMVILGHRLPRARTPTSSGIVQIFVYTGAVMMLFLFVIMLVGVDSSRLARRDDQGAALGVAAARRSASACLLVTTIGRWPSTGPARRSGGRQRATGNVTGIANLIFGPYVWVFEMTSALLITAALARDGAGPPRAAAAASRPSASGAERRFRENRYVAGLPAPGVYARHNAVDTPALLPDGTPERAVGLAGARARATRSRTPDGLHRRRATRSSARSRRGRHR